MPFCTDCGYYTDEEVKICPKCGRGKREPGAYSGGAGSASGFAAQTQTQYESQSRQESEPRAEYNAQSKSRWDYDKHTGAFYEKTAEVFDKAAGTGAGHERLLAACSYLGPLVLIPIFLGVKSPFVRFHANQGLVNLIAATAAYVGGGVINALRFLPLAGLVSAALSILGFCCTVFAIMGVMNALKLQYKELPLIGGIRLLK